MNRITEREYNENNSFFSRINSLSFHLLSMLSSFIELDLDS